MKKKIRKILAIILFILFSPGFLGYYLTGKCFDLLDWIYKELFGQNQAKQ